MRAAAHNDKTVLRLLAAAQRRPAAPAEAVPAADYDWQRPCSFRPEQRKRLEQLSARIAQETAAHLSRLLGQAIAAKPRPAEESFLSRLSFDPARPGYFATLIGAADQRCGFLFVAADLALAWAGRLLGAAEAAKDRRELTPLESALLADLLAGSVRAVQSAMPSFAGGSLRCGQGLAGAAPLEGGDPGDEYVLLSIEIGAEGPQPGITFFLPALAVAAAVGSGAGAGPAQDARKAMQSHVERAAVPAEVSLGRAQPTMRDIVNLQPGDVLLLNAHVDAPAELFVHGERIVAGHAVCCEGCYAIRVAGRPDAGRKAAPAAGPQ